MSGTRDRGLVVWAVALAVVAVVLPESWLTGGVEAADPRHLAQGVLFLRGALCLIAGLLAIAHLSGGTPAMQSPRRERTPWPALFWATLAVAAALRLVRLGAPMWFDEIWMLLDCVRPPLSESLRTFATDNNHPLYSFLATLCARTFGESAWALRLPAAAFGVAGVAALFVFARERLGTRTALAAAAILAVSAQHVSFSQNARGYTGLLLFGIVASHAFLTALETGRRSAWICHGLALAACVALHLTGAFFAFGHLAVLVWAAWRRPAWLAPDGLRAGLYGIALATLAAFAAYALVFPQVLAFFRKKPEPLPAKAEWTKPTWFLEETARSFGLAMWAAWTALAVGTALVVAGLVHAWRRMPSLVLLTVVPGVAMAGVMLALGRNLWPRLFFFLAGFAVLIAVEGVLAVARAVARRLGRMQVAAPRFEIAAAVAVIAASAALLPRAYALPKQDYGAAKDYVESARKPGEPVLTIGRMANYIYRDYYHAGFTEVDHPEDLSRALPPGTTGYGIYTFPPYLKSRVPDVWEIVQRDGREVARFPASIGDGDLVVVRFGR